MLRNVGTFHDVSLLYSIRFLSHSHYLEMLLKHLHMLDYFYRIIINKLLERVLANPVWLYISKYLFFLTDIRILYIL